MGLSLRQSIHCHEMSVCADCDSLKVVSWVIDYGCGLRLWMSVKLEYHCTWMIDGVAPATEYSLS